MRTFCFFLLCIFCVDSADAGDYVKYVRKIFPVTEGTDFYLESKFGHITLHQWEKDSILLEATFRVEQAEDWEKESMAEQLDFKFESWTGTLKIHTDIEKEFEQAGNLKIEMSLWVPEEIVMDLVNRYGCLYVPDYRVRRHLSLTAVYGDIRIDTLCSESDKEVYLNVSYGKLEVGKCSRVSVKSSYSSVGVGKARFLDIKAEKSQIVVEAADTLKSTGNYNLYQIKDCN